MRSAVNLAALPPLRAEPQPNEGQRVRSLIRQAAITGTSRGQAMGFLQCNLAILPQAHANDFWLYCQRNARACPVLEVTRPGYTCTYTFTLAHIRLHQKAKRISHRP